MRILLLFFLLVLTQEAISQSQPELLVGGWTTSNAVKATVINTPAIQTSRIYRIDCSTTPTDGNINQVEIIVDGVSLPYYLVEGSFIMVEGKNIAIKQIGNAPIVKGTWKVIQQAEITPEKINWNGYPALNREMLVADFKTEQEFVLTINLISTGCTTTAMIVYVDGNPVMDSNGAPLSFSQGSSINGKGKRIHIRVSGTCGSASFVAGDFKIAKKM